jgi:sucrose synthase
LRNDILQEFAAYCTKHQKPATYYRFSPLGELVHYTQEIILQGESLCLIIRPRIASMQAFRILEDLTVEPMMVAEVLDLRDQFVNRYNPHEGELLEIDFGSFYDYSPRLRDPKNIGKGVQYLNRYLASKLFADPLQWLEALFQFLSLHSYNGLQLLINQRIQNHQQLSEHVKQAIQVLAQYPEKTPYEDFRFDLQPMGFEPGWGNTAGRVRETLEMLDQLLDSPDYQELENFLSRIPMILKIVLVSPHGWFGQEGVLGRPDTGGQVVYVLDQARSLDEQLEKDVRLAGLDVLDVKHKVIILTRLIPNSEGTLCNQRLEKVHGSDNVWILRVPFREFNPKVTENWISRMEIWPY